MSNSVWERAFQQMNGEMSKKYIFLYISQNRKGILSQLSDRYGVQNQSINLSSDTKNDTSTESNWSICSPQNNLSSLRAVIKIPKESWDLIQPRSVIYKDRTYEVLKQGWTDVVYTHLWTDLRLPCSFTFKNAKINRNPGEIFLKISGSCSECGSKLNAYSLNLPKDDGLELNVSTFDTKGIVHKNKRQMRGATRQNVVKELCSSSTYSWRRQKANELMQFGDVEPANLYNECVLRKAKQIELDKQLGLNKITDPVFPIHELKYNAEFAGTIREVGLDKFWIMYWSNEQTLLCKEFIKFDNVGSVSIDATGSIIKKIVRLDGSSSPIFLYQCVASLNGKILPIFQMLSEKHDANILIYWIREWLRSGAPCPNQVVIDYSLALLNAVSLAFDKTDLNTYIDRCFGVLQSHNSDERIGCVIRLDIAHLIKLICGFKCFEGKHPQVKDFFVRCVGILTNCTTLESFRQILCYTLSVAFAELEDPGDKTNICYSSQKRLLELIKTYNFEFIENTNDIAMELPESHSCFNNTEGNLNERSGNRLASFLEELAAESKETPGTGKRPNPYHCPDFGKKLLALAKHFVIWTAVLSNSHQAASSSRSEKYFREVKQPLLAGSKGMRVDKFLVKHIRALSGTMKILYASLDRFRKPENQSRIAIADGAFLDQSTASQILEPVPHNVNQYESTDKNDLLNEEESWRGLNNPPKKRGKYLTPCSDVEHIHRKPTFSKHLPLLLNGSILAPMKVQGKVLNIIYTCPFDTSTQILLVAYRDWREFHEHVEATNNEMFELIVDLSRSGTTQNIYKKQMAMMSKVVKPVRNTLNCAFNISNLISDHLLQNEPSIEVTRICRHCKYDTTVKKIVIEVPTLPFYENRMRGLQTAINESCRPMPYNCNRCNSDNVLIPKTSGHLLFIDLECLLCKVLAERMGYANWTGMFTISEIPPTIECCDTSYKALAAIIYYGEPRTDVIGHYTSFIQRLSGKWEIHNDLSREKKPILATQRSLLQMQQIPVLIFIKS